MRDGTLYIKVGEDLHPLISINDDFKIEETAAAEDAPAFNKIAAAAESITLSIKMTAEAIQKLTDTILKVRQTIIDCCPNKRVRHLARYGKPKQRKKNFNRAVRIIKKSY